MLGAFLSANAIPSNPLSAAPLNGADKPISSVSGLPTASRIFVRNLSYHTSETSLRKTFSNFGQIVEVKLPRDEDAKRSKGYAFVQYSCQDDAILAMEHMDHKALDGRVVYVEIAKPTSKDFGAYPRSLGPPKQQNPGQLSSSELFNVDDMWY